MTARNAKLLIQLDGERDCITMAGKQLCSERPWGPGEQEVEHEPASVAMKAVCVLGYITTGCVQFWAPSIRKILSNWSKTSQETYLGGVYGMRRKIEGADFVLPEKERHCLQLPKVSYRHGKA